MHGEYLSQFRGMYLTLGDLQYKKEANIAALEEKMEHARMQQEMMMESLNPKAKEYSALRKDLQKTRDDMESQVHTLREKSVLYIEAFEPTKQALLHAGKDFQHPVDELTTLNEQRRNKLIAYHQLLEEEAAGGAQDLDAEREQIDLLRLTYQSQPRGSPRQDGAQMAPA